MNTSFFVSFFNGFTRDENNFINISTQTFKSNFNFKREREKNRFYT